MRALSLASLFALSIAFMACHAPLPDAEVIRPGQSGEADGGSGDSGMPPDVDPPVEADGGDPVVIPETDAGMPPDPRAQDGALWRMTAENGGLAALTLTEVNVTSEGELELSATGGTQATDSYRPGTYKGGNYYNGGSYRFGVVLSSDKVIPGGFDIATPHVEAMTPAGTWIALKVAARVKGVWSKDYVLGIWASDEGTVSRHSVDAQADALGTVNVSQLQLTQRADAIRLSAVLFSEGNAVPRIRALGVRARLANGNLPALPSTRTAWGTALDVPAISEIPFPEGAKLAAPTTLSMVLGYWGNKLGVQGLADPVPVAAARNFDFVMPGNHNFIFNIAYATSRANGRLHGFVTFLSSFAQVEPLIQAGVPVVISVRYSPATGVDGAPLQNTSGHFVVVRGFDINGNVLVNDPGFPMDARVRVTYNRAQLEAAWKASAGRSAYVIYPVEMKLPADPLGAY